MSDHSHDTSAPWTLNEQEKQTLHRAACLIAAAEAHGRSLDAQQLQLGRLANLTVVGVFVTLRKAGQLRSCIGNFADAAPLADALERAARGAVSQDPRFPRVVPQELAELDVEVSLLHSRRMLPPDAEARRSAIEVGRHGLDIQAGPRKGLLLPQVPVEWGWDVDAFLVAVCRKAGLPPDAWRDPQTTLYVFEALKVSGPFSTDPISNR